MHLILHFILTDNFDFSSSFSFDYHRLPSRNKQKMRRFEQRARLLKKYDVVRRPGFFPRRANHNL